MSKHIMLTVLHLSDMLEIIVLTVDMKVAASYLFSIVLDIFLHKPTQRSFCPSRFTSVSCVLNCYISTTRASGLVSNNVLSHRNPKFQSCQVCFMNWNSN